MTSIKDKFIRDLVDELNKENNTRIYNHKTPLNVCFMVSVINQNIENCKEFIDDINNHTYCIHSYENDQSEGYTNGKIKIVIEKPKEEQENECDYYYDYCYYIEFLYDDRSWGYCECSPDMEGYNEKHKCCGDGCDWYAPAFRLYKAVELGYGVWEGMERDYWEYEEEFLANEQNRNEEVEKFKKEKKKKDLEEQIKELQEKLKELAS